MGTSTVNILLVEDDDVDVEAVRRGLKRQKIANPLTVAADGIEALAILRGEGDRTPLAKPFIILLDLNMPRMSGLEFLEALRADPVLSNSVVFVLTTSKDDEDKTQAYKQHVAGYIVKENVGTAFVDLVTMLDCYWRVVELPQ